MTNIDAELKVAFNEFCAKLAGTRHYLSEVASTAGGLASGGGPKGPVPPKQTLIDLVAHSSNLSELATALHGQAVVLQNVGNSVGGLGE